MGAYQSQLAGLKHTGAGGKNRAGLSGRPCQRCGFNQLGPERGNARLGNHHLRAKGEVLKLDLQ